jgi:DNA-binding transcriptional LysR family regulator
MSIDANDLILFARVVEAGSFSGTTARTGLPKSTISRRIAQLETRLGERLLVRNTRRLVISEFGERILEHARRLTEEAEAVLDFTLHRQDTPCGVLRISMMPELVEIGLGDLCHEFATKYPEVRLDLDLSPRRVDLLSERFDIALRSAMRLPDDSMLVARKLCEFRLGLYASSDYLARHGMPQHPDDLQAHSCLRLVASSGDPIHWQLARGEEERWERVPGSHIATNSPRLLRDLVASGAGIGELPDYFAHEMHQQGLLHHLLADWHSPVAPLWCVTPGRRLLPSRTTAFIDMLRARLQKYPDLSI